MINMTKEEAMRIIELHKTVPQKIELLRKAIQVLGSISAPGQN